ncbi:vps26b, partial [Symbiodinium sp. KB8]
YFLRATCTRGYSSNLSKAQELWVQALHPAPELNTTIKMEVGIENCLHIEFEYSKSKYHLNDVITGKIFFLLVKIKIKTMELAIIRREQAGAGASAYNESDTLAKFEVMDGAPVRGECIPIRLYLGTYNLTPTYPGVDNKFSVRYYLNLILIDEEDRRYFKQQEISLWRKEIG